MSPLIVALLSFAVAFVAGAMLSKALYASQGQATDMVEREKHHALLKAQRSRYRKRVAALYHLVRRHEATQQQIKEKLVHYQKVMESREESSRADRDKVGQLQAELTPAQQTRAGIDRERTELNARLGSLEAELKAERAKSAHTANELGLLRREREELTARMRRVEREQPASNGADNASPDAAEKTAAEARANTGALRETLTAREQEIVELKTWLRESSAQKQHLEDRLETMTQRVAPLTQKLRQQRQLLRQLRQAAALRDGDTPVSADPDDNLKDIRGIGPALERKLRGHGIRRFAQLAEMSEQELRDVSASLSIAPNMGCRQQWIQQARELQRNLHSSS